MEKKTIWFMTSRWDECYENFVISFVDITLIMKYYDWEEPYNALIIIFSRQYLVYYTLKQIYIEITIVCDLKLYIYFAIYEWSKNLYGL